MAEKKILLITGGTGYIGSHAVVAFEQAGYRTVIIDNLVNSSRDSLIGIEKILGYCPDFYECDIQDWEWLEKIFQKYDFDGVIHFAGLKAVGESCDHVGRYHENNVGGSLVLFGMMQKYGVQKIVFSSSATVYRSDNISPLTEDMPTGTTNPYGTTKLVIEKLLEDYSRHAGWSVTVLRYFNPIGAHPSGWIWEAPQGVPNNLLPYVLDVALGKRDTLYIFGNDYDTLDGTGVRDYIDVNDLVEAHIMAYEKLTSWFFLYNVGTGEGHSVLEMIDLMEEISWKKIDYEVVERRSGDLATVYAGTNLIIDLLHWIPKRNAQDSILTSLNFIKRRVE